MAKGYEFRANQPVRNGDKVVTIQSWDSKKQVYITDQGEFDEDSLKHVSAGRFYRQFLNFTTDERTFLEKIHTENCTEKYGTIILNIRDLKDEDKSTLHDIRTKVSGLIESPYGQEKHDNLGDIIHSFIKQDPNDSYVVKIGCDNVKNILWYIDNP